MAKVTLTLEDTSDGGVLITSDTDGFASDPSPLTYAELLMAKMLDQFHEWFPNMENMIRAKGNAKA
jgi:hypothetical protein